MRDDSKQKKINTYREQISRPYTWVSSSLFLAESLSFFETNFHSTAFSRHTLYLYLNASNRLNLECKISIAPTQQRQTVKWCWILVLRKLLLVQLNARKGGLVPLPLVLKTVTLSSCDKRGVHLSEGKNGSYVAGTKV